jgi:3-deoxy-D-manno-octulosonic-acid transferase
MADRLGNAVLAAYRLTGRAMTPMLPWALSRRAKRGKEDPSRIGERHGKASIKRPPGRVVWVHAASVGETNAVLPLIRRLVEAGLAVVFTSVTVTSAGIAASKLPQGARHQFAPMDVPSAVDSFIAHWRPELALFVESELWPTTIAALRERGIPLVLVNARLSERSFRGWQRFGSVAHALVGRLSLCLAQSKQDADRYRTLGVKDVQVTGNLKFDVPAPDADPAALAAFRSMAGGRPLWVAASTHAGEEAIAAAVHRVLQRQIPKVLTVIVPRHPERGAAIRSEIAATGLSVAERSLDEPVLPITDIYLADTLGELGLFYRATPAVFLGGSLVDRGGQNPIEAVGLGCAVLHGPHIHNFADSYEAIDAAVPKAAIGYIDELAERLAELLVEPEIARHQAKKLSLALKPLAGALDATMTALQPYLDKGARA